jgi:transcriptional regulator with XRE-family HTH domain
MTTDTSKTEAERRPTSHLLARERFSEKEMADIRRDFSQRLTRAFGTANIGDIARRLSTTYATVQPYVKGTRLPTSELLMEIHRVTGYNIQWLLTGKGPQRVEGEDLFTDEQENQIREIAKRRGISYEDAVRHLVQSALDFNKQISS